MSPAILGTVLAGLNYDSSLRDAIIGDLVEEHCRLAAEQGERRANRWMWQQVLRSIPAFVASAIRTGGIRLVMRMLGAAVAALLVTALMIGVASRLWSTFLPETLQQLVIVAIIVDLAFGAGGGYLAAKFGRAAPLGTALVFGIIGLSLTMVLGGSMPAAYRLALVLLLLPAALSGGWLRVHHVARHPGFGD